MIFSIRNVWDSSQSQPPTPEEKEENIPKALAALKQALSKDTPAARHLIEQFSFQQLVGGKSQVESIWRSVFPNKVLPESSDSFFLLKNVIEDLINKSISGRQVLSILLQASKTPDFPENEKEKLLRTVDRKFLGDKNPLLYLQDVPEDQLENLFKWIGEKKISSWSHQNVSTKSSLLSPHRSKKELIFEKLFFKEGLSKKSIRLLINYNTASLLWNSTGKNLIHRLAMSRSENIIDKFLIIKNELGERKFTEVMAEQDIKSQTPLELIYKTNYSSKHKKIDRRFCQLIDFNNKDILIKFISFISSEIRLKNIDRSQPLDFFQALLDMGMNRQFLFNIYIGNEDIWKKKIFNLPISPNDFNLPISPYEWDTKILNLLLSEENIQRNLDLDVLANIDPDFFISKSAEFSEKLNLSPNMRNTLKELSRLDRFAFSLYEFKPSLANNDPNFTEVLHTIRQFLKKSQPNLFFLDTTYFYAKRNPHFERSNIKKFSTSLLNCIELSKDILTRQQMFVALQTCEDLDELEYFLSLPPLKIDSVQAFLNLSTDQQIQVLTGSVLFRDRKGLSFVSKVLENAVKGHPIDKKLIQQALRLLQKTQILQNPESDENNLLHLIFALWEATQGAQHEQTTLILTKAITALANLDFVRLKKQYRAGIFEIFKSLEKDLKHNSESLTHFITALALYDYQPSKNKDREILDHLIALMKQPSTPDNLKITLAEKLSTITYEPALINAWDVVKGPLWNRYQHADEGDNRTMKLGEFELFTRIPVELHENRGIIKRRTLTQLSEINQINEEIEKIYKDYSAKNPSKLNDRITSFENFLRAIPQNEVRYVDPLYLPPNSVVFRGLCARHGSSLGIEAMLDLFERGVGDCSLTKASPQVGIWAKTGQIFCALDKTYAQGFTNDLGAMIVIKGDYVNQAITKRRVRQQKEIGSLHFVLYDTISQEHLEKIYISKGLYHELSLIRNNDPKTIDLSTLTFFKDLSEDELLRFSNALKQDSHNLFQKIQPSDDFSRNKNVIEFPETSIEEVIQHNIKKEIGRILMEEKYANHFTPIKSRL